MSSKKEKEKRKNHTAEYERMHHYWVLSEPSIFLFKKHRAWKKDEPTYKNMGDPRRYDDCIFDLTATSKSNDCIFDLTSIHK